ncbi:cofactor FMO1 FAD enzyme [Hypoxylon trugodes]|uniref:cofactor FMO1 FAD enzyme n=1 Tax=Hypoxylon trugodes TaxID=326681 RepID=UPI00219A0D3F|nr:cofactor FMO1 FAD enzyme [Hypoxylon trugodes]KAI1387728.1 cofactor FMO1 FAD enzyme [Hypoxylon trugodes]
MEAEQVDCVVVGTGWTGLICAKTYLDFEPHANVVLIDDGESIGGAWRIERIYPSLYAQVKYGQFEYSFFPMRREGITKDGYIPGDTINRYLVEFAEAYDLVRRSRLSTTVCEIIRLPGRGWRLELSGGKRPVECAKLIYASGPTSHAVVPSWPMSNFHIPTIHSVETGAHLDALDKIQRATVVGGAKSAFDTVFLLLKARKQVDWVIRKDGAGPAALMPPTIFGLVNTIDVMSTRAFAAFGASIMATKGLSYRLIHKTALGQTCHKAFWRFVNWIADTHAGYSKSPNAFKLKPIPHGEGIFWASGGLGCASVPDFWKVFHAGDCTVHRSEPESLVDNTVKLQNGVALNPDYVVLCTGFDKNWDPFSRDLQRECGLKPDPGEADKWTQLEAKAVKTVDDVLPVLRNPGVKLRDLKSINHEMVAGEKKELSHGPSRHYRRMVCPRPASQGDTSIIFPGLMHNVYTPLVGEVQALWGVAFLLGLHKVPSLAEMEKEVAEWNVWTGKRYLTQGRKHSYGIYDFVSYIDLLLSDLGVATRRKSNFLADKFLPNLPKHYRGLVDEYQRAQACKSQAGFAQSAILDTTPVTASQVMLFVTFVAVLGTLLLWLSRD